jgi:hypothetical protein
MRWLEVFIGPNHFHSHWWMLLAMDASDSPVRHRKVTMHYTVCTTSARPLGFGVVDCWRALSSCCIGQSGATSDSPVPSDFCALTSATTLSTTVALHSRLLACREPLLRWLTGRSGGTPDSPVNYSGARLWITESSLFGSVRAWCTGHCPMRQNSAHSKSFAPNLIASLTEFLSWFVLNLMHMW